MEGMKRRQTELDLLRLIAMLGVIVVHIELDGSSAPQSRFGVTLYHGIWSSVTWCVPIFVMISGRLFLDPVRDITMQKIWKKYIPRIATAFLFWSAIYQVYYSVLGGQTLNWKGILSQFLIGPYHMWYLYMIAGLYAVTPILRKISGDVEITKYFVILFFFAELLKEYGPYLPVVGSTLEYAAEKINLNVVLGMTGYYVLGWHLYRTELTKKQETAIYLAGLLALCFTIFAASNLPIPEGQSTEFYQKYPKPNVILESAALYTFFVKRICKARFSDWLAGWISLLAENCFGIYLIHALVNEFVCTGSWKEAFSPFLAVPVLVFLIFAISAVIIIPLRKIPFVRKHLT